MHDRACFARHMGHYFCEPRVFCAAVEAIRDGTLKPRSEASVPAAAEGRKPYAMLGNIALIGIEGVMFKGFSKFADTNTVQVRRDVRAASSDADVKGIMLLVDSPGGGVAGTEELAADIAEAASRKPMRAYIEDLGASAAYWAASQARSVSVNRAGETGSIGAVVLVYDVSRAAEMDGVKVHVVSTGGMKGAFAKGAPVTGEMLAYAQERIDADGARFFAAVKSARGFDDGRMAAVTDGRVFGSAKALELGLVDRVETFDEALAGLRDEIAAEARSGRVDRMRAAAAEGRLERALGGRK